MKLCSKCGCEKAVDLFPKKGHQCKACVAARDSEYVERNRAKVQARKNAWQAEKRKALAATNPQKPPSALQLAIAAGEKTYFTGVPCKQGHLSLRLVDGRKCVECSRAYSGAYKRKNASILAPKSRAAAKRYRAQNPEKAAASQRKSAAKYRDRVNATNRAWQQRNKAYVQAAARGRQLAKHYRTPKWLSPDVKWMMEQAYDIARIRSEHFGFLWHVDRIIPLRGKLVSGLHVPSNLQVIPASDNLRKSNRVEGP